jgi:repressor LexA
MKSTPRTLFSAALAATASSVLPSRKQQRFLDFIQTFSLSNGKRALTLPEEHATPARLPLLGLIAAGMPIEALENAETIDVPKPFMHPDNFVLKVKGDSMIGDHIEDGDYIIVRKTGQARKGQPIVAIINGEATLKRYYPKSDRVELHPRNPDYPVITVTESDNFQINGVVLYSFREY